MPSNPNTSTSGAHANLLPSVGNGRLDRTHRFGGAESAPASPEAHMKANPLNPTVTVTVTVPRTIDFAQRVVDIGTTTDCEPLRLLHQQIATSVLREHAAAHDRAFPPAI